MKDIEKWKNASTREIRWMIRTIKFFRFFSTRFGEFVLSFIFIVGLNILFFGPHFTLFVLLLFFHSIYFFFFSKIIFSRLRVEEDYIEYTSEIETLTKILKEKNKIT